MNMMPVVFIAMASATMASPGGVSAQEPPDAPATRASTGRISVTWTEAPIRDVLHAFSAFSGRSIVAGAGVDGFVTADINDQPWDVALRTILTARGLVAIEEESGIIHVDDMTALVGREANVQLVTRSYRLSFTPVSEIRAAIESLLSERGTLGVLESSNTLVVTDVPRVHRVVSRLIGR